MRNRPPAKRSSPITRKIPTLTALVFMSEHPPRARVPASFRCSLLRRSCRRRQSCLDLIRQTGRRRHARPLHHASPPPASHSFFLSAAPAVGRSRLRLCGPVRCWVRPPTELVDPAPARAPSRRVFACLPITVPAWPFHLS